MKGSSSAQVEADGGRSARLNETKVARFLRNHPDFFERHMSLLAILKVPHPVGGAVSLIERQASVLRQQNQQLERKLRDLVEVARDNERLSLRLHRLSLRLMGAQDAESAVAISDGLLREELDCHYVTFVLRPDVRALAAHAQGRAGPVTVRNLSDDGRRLFQVAIRDRRPHSGRLRATQLRFLFGEDAPAVGSAALLPLVAEAEFLGLLGLGSQDPLRFSPTLGTLFLAYFGELIGHALMRPGAVPGQPDRAAPSPHSPELNP